MTVARCITRFLSIVMVVTTLCLGTSMLRLHTPPTQPVGTSFLLAASSSTASTTGSMVTARYQHAAVLLSDGRVMITGGVGSDGRRLSSTEFYSPSAGVFTAGPSMLVARSGHTATVLGNGDVLVAGGFGDAISGNNNAKELASAELWRPQTDSWSAVAPMASGRALHTATLLTDGRVLVVGAIVNGPVSTTAEVFDPDTAGWQTIPQPTVFRAGHTATRLSNGDVLVVGGSGTTGPTTSAELFQPASNIWRSTSPLSVARVGQTASLLSDGRVLVVGGTGGATVTEIYSPGTGTWAAGPRLMQGRSLHAAAPDGPARIAIIGGITKDGSSADAEVIDLSTNQAAPASFTSQMMAMSVTTFADGTSLITGGIAPSSGTAQSSSTMVIPTASASGDDYPSEYKNACQDCLVDRWGFYNRECTSFAAWRMERDGHPMSNNMNGGHFGNATTWASNARAIGIPISGTPVAGAVAAWDEGHVAYDTSFANGTLNVEEYNFATPGAYGTRALSGASSSYSYNAVPSQNLVFGAPPVQPSGPSPDTSASNDGTITFLAAGVQKQYIFQVASSVLHVRWWDGTSWNWGNLSVPSGLSFPQSRIGTVTYVDNSGNRRLYAFLPSTVGHLEIPYWDATTTYWKWGDAYNVPGAPTASVVDVVGTSALLDGSTEKMYAFTRLSDGSLWLFYWDGTAWHWSDMSTVAGAPTSISDASGTLSYMDPSGTTMANFHIYSFVIGGGNLYVFYYSPTNGSWNWGTLGNPGSSVTTGLGAVTYYEGSDQRLYAYFSDANGHLRLSYYTGSVGGYVWQWADLGASPSGAISGRVGTDTYISANVRWIHNFIWTTSGHLVLNVWNGSAWAWTDQGAPAGGSATRGLGDVTYPVGPAQNVYAWLMDSAGNLETNYYANGWAWSNQGVPS